METSKLSPEGTATLRGFFIFMNPRDFVYVAKLETRGIMLNTQLALCLGLNKSIVVQQIHYWLCNHQEKDRNFFDGKYWVYNSITEWQTQLPYFSLSTIKRIILDLEKDKILVSSNHHSDPFKRSKWYSIDYHVLYNSISDK